MIVLFVLVILSLILRSSIYYINSVMFSVKSAKELVTNLEHLIFKNKNTEILTNDDPEQVSALHKNRL